MTNEIAGEKWKNIKFDIEHTNVFTMQVSNMGRIRTYNSISDGGIINGSMINGYKIIKFKLFKLRDKKLQAKFDKEQKKVFELARIMKFQINDWEKKNIIKASTELYLAEKEKLSKKFADDLKARTINYHSLIHRLVANYFLMAPKKNESVVAHLDHNKLNNRADNLKWMTAEENYAHQAKSPAVIKDKKLRQIKNSEKPTAAKLTVEKVLEIKKLLEQGKNVIKIAAKYKVSDVQVYRIKRGENWKGVKI